MLASLHTNVTAVPKYILTEPLAWLWVMVTRSEALNTEETLADAQTPFQNNKAESNRIQSNAERSSSCS